MAFTSMSTSSPHFASPLLHFTVQFGRFSQGNGTRRGAWRRIPGGVFGGGPPFWSIRSNCRKTKSPSTMTSKENVSGTAFPLILFEMIPRSVPGSSPVLVEKSDPRSMIDCPSIFTVVLPFAVFCERAMFG